jgi:hypothetical protein
VGEDVETYWDGRAWRNRVVGRGELPGEHTDAEAAIDAGRTEARIRGVEHVIRRTDGTVADRRRYPRTTEELPG